MKKILTIALIFVMALCAAAPAMAYTTNTSPANGQTLCKLDIYLVEYTGGDRLSMFISQTPTDRGYAKNEIVAAIGSVTVPANTNVLADGFTSLNFKGTDVNLNVTENNPVGNVNNNRFALMHTMPAAANWQDNQWILNDNILSHVLGSPANTSVFPVSSSSNTYRFLVFGKVLSDNASLSISLSRRAGFLSLLTVPTQVATTARANYSASKYLLIGDNYIVFDSVGTNEYLVFSTPPGGYAGGTIDQQYLCFRIGRDSRNRTTQLYMYPNGAQGIEYRVTALSSIANLMFIYSGNSTPSSNIILGDRVTNSGLNSSLNYFYGDNFENGLGLSAYNEGNYLTDSDWTTISGAGDVSKSVHIQPWTPYVGVPENIVVNPPKTGELANVLGFVMIALAGAAVVLIKKVRA